MKKRYIGFPENDKNRDRFNPLEAVAMEQAKLQMQIQMFFDCMPFMAWYKDLEGKYQLVNLAFCKECKKEKSDILGKGDEEVWSPSLAAQYREDDRRTLELVVPRHFDEESEGTWFEVFKSPVWDKDGTLLGVLGTKKDISKRKQIEAELREQRWFLQSILDAIPDLIFYKDPKGVYLACNRSVYETFLGRKEEDVLGKTDKELFSDQEMVKRFRKRDKEVMKVGQTIIGEEHVQFVSGGDTDLETSKTPFYDEGGNLKGVIGISRDITERKKILRDLRESELRLNLATESAMVGLWDWEIEEGTTIINRQWAEMLGYQMEELEPIGVHTWMKLVHPEDLNRVQNAMNQCFQGKTDYYECELRLKHKEGTWLWILDRGNVVSWRENGNPKRMLGTHVNISKQKRTEEMLRKNERILSAVSDSIRELIENRQYFDAVLACIEKIGTAAKIDRICLFVKHKGNKGEYLSPKLHWMLDPKKCNGKKEQGLLLKTEVFSEIIEHLEQGESFQGTVEEVKNASLEKIMRERNVKSFLLFPIFIKHRFWGFLSFDECFQHRKWTQTEISALSAFSSSVEKAIERTSIENELEEKNERLKLAYEKMKNIAITDPLTGLYNRREGMARMLYEKSRYDRKQMDFSILVGDIDFFKRVNDTYGHSYGDTVLKSLAKLFRDNVRLQDSVCRWGGEEFLILLPDTNLEGAYQVAEKLRRETEKFSLFAKEEKIQVTITFGVIAYSQVSTLDELVAKADEALYRGKENGRNQSVPYPPHK